MTVRKETVKKASEPDRPSGRIQPLKEELLVLTKEQKKLYEENEGLVGYFARDFFRWADRIGVPREDVLSAGKEGLLRATQTYDKELGYKIATYAQHWIKNRITKLLRNKTENAKGDGRLRSYEDMGPKEIRKDMAANDPGALGAETPDMEGDISGKEELEKVRGILKKLDIPERDKLIFGMKLDGKKDVEIADSMGLTRARIGQIIPRIMAMIRKELRRQEITATTQAEREGTRMELKTAVVPQKPANNNATQKTDTTKSIYYTLRKITGKDPKETLDLLMNQNIPITCDRIKNALKSRFPKATNAEIAHAINMEINRFQLVTIKGELYWKWNHTKNRTIYIVGKETDVDPPAILREKAGWILRSG